MKKELVEFKTHSIEKDAYIFLCTCTYILLSHIFLKKGYLFVVWLTVLERAGNLEWTDKVLLKSLFKYCIAL